MLETAWESRWLPDFKKISFVMHIKRKQLLLSKCSLQGGVAQLGEHLPCKQGVKSSNLSVSIIRKD